MRSSILPFFSAACLLFLLLFLCIESYGQDLPSASAPASPTSQLGVFERAGQKADETIARTEAKLKEAADAVKTGVAKAAIATEEKAIAAKDAAAAKAAAASKAAKEAAAAAKAKSIAVYGSVKQEGSKLANSAKAAVSRAPSGLPSSVASDSSASTSTKPAAGPASPFPKGESEDGQK